MKKRLIKWAGCSISMLLVVVFKILLDEFRMVEGDYALVLFLLCFIAPMIVQISFAILYFCRHENKHAIDMIIAIFFIWLFAIIISGNVIFYRPI
jgi:hypothetical protein